GFVCAVGLVLLIHRRLTIARVRHNSRPMDFAVLYLLLAQVLLGLYSITVSLEHRDGAEMLKFMSWAQAIVTFQPGAAAYITDVAWVFKAHIVLGLTLFVVFPFSRLVHIWSGFGTVG